MGWNKDVPYEQHLADHDDYWDKYDRDHDLVEPPTFVCPIGNRPDCKYLHIEGRNIKSQWQLEDEQDYWCEHPSLGGEDTCPLNQVEKEDE